MWRRGLVPTDAAALAGLFVLTLLSVPNDKAQQTPALFTCGEVGHRLTVVYTVVSAR